MKPKGEVSAFEVETGESGYALIAALLSIILFALMALAVINTMRGPAIMVASEAERARLSAAADGGVALAVEGLLLKDANARWKFDGKPREVVLDDIRLTITIEDERGKIPLNQINEEQAGRMFGYVGLQGIELEEAVDSFMDWRDENYDARPRGGEFEYYADRGIKPRNGQLQTVEELALIKGVGKTIADRLIPVSTVNFGKEEFDPRYASRIAKFVSAEDEEDTNIVEFSETFEQGQIRRAYRPSASDGLIGRPFMVRVSARSGPEAQAQIKAIIELTGVETSPYLVRARE